jgi:hypothetical protein
MNKAFLTIIATSAMLVSSSAFAAVCSNTAGAVGGAAAGAAAGAAVGGPAGAAVGGVVGGAIGSQSLPPTACTHVVQAEVPVTNIEGQVVVGEPLPEVVVLHPIPETETYVFAYVNDQRVLVDPESRVVVEVVQ